MEQKLCVLIDFENLAAGTEKAGLGRFDIRVVMRRLKDKGRILVSRSYGDWGRFAKFKQSLLEQGVSMMELTSYKGQEKNRADIALVVDAMELAYTRPYLDTFVLMSGDSDFTPLVLRLKELNKRVIGIGTRESTSRLLLECCDEFIFYRSLRGRSRSSANTSPKEAAPSAPARGSSLGKDLAFELLSETLRGVSRDSEGPVLAGLLKQSMKRKEPAFDENEYGYTSFARFLDAARDQGLVRLTRDPRAGGYRVESADAPLPDDASDTSSGQSQSGADSERSGRPGQVATPTHKGEAADLVDALNEMGFNPWSHQIRKVIVEELVQHVQDRQSRKKRNTLMYLYGDITRRCGRLDPRVPGRMVRTVLNALRESGVFLHSNGKPIRSQTAHFTLTSDPAALTSILQRFYLSRLMSSGLLLEDPTVLSQLLWSDEEHLDQARQLLDSCQSSVSADPADPAEADPKPAASTEAAAVVADTPSSLEPAAPAPKETTAPTEAPPSAAAPADPAPADPAPADPAPAAPAETEDT